MAVDNGDKYGDEVVPLQRDIVRIKYRAPVSTGEIEIQGIGIYTSKTARPNVGAARPKTWYRNAGANKLVRTKMAKLCSTDLNYVATIRNKNIKHGTGRVCR